MLSEYAALLPPTWRTEVDKWLQEDLPSFDVGGFVVGGERMSFWLFAMLHTANRGLKMVGSGLVEKEEVAHLLCKSDGVFSGMPFATGMAEASRKPSVLHACTNAAVCCDCQPFICSFDTYGRALWCLFCSCV